MSDHEGALKQLFKILESVNSDLDRDAILHSEKDFPSIVGAITRLYFETCTECLLPKFVFGRVLIGTGKESLDYHPNSPLIRPSGTAPIPNDFAALLTYIRLSEKLKNQNRGGGITRRLAQKARPPRRLLMLPVHAPRQEFSAVRYDDSLTHIPNDHINALRQIFDPLLNRILSTGPEIGPDNFHQFEVGDIYPQDAPLPQVLSDDLSYSLVRTWFEVAQLECYWICGIPYTNSRYPWGGMYFLAREPPTEDQILLTGVLSREIFLRAHHIEQTRESERTKIYERIRQETDVFAKYHWILSEVAVAAEKVVKVVDHLSMDNSKIVAASGALAPLFKAYHNVGDAMKPKNIETAKVMLNEAVLKLKSLPDDEGAVNVTVARIEECLKQNKLDEALKAAKSLNRGSISLASLDTSRSPQDYTYIKCINSGDADEAGSDHYKTRLQYAVVQLGQLAFSKNLCITNHSDGTFLLCLAFDGAESDWKDLKAEIKTQWGNRTALNYGELSRKFATIIRGILGSRNPDKLDKFLDDKCSIADRKVVIRVATKHER